MIEMKVILEEFSYVPELAHDTDSGYDIRTPYAFTVFPNHSYVVHTGIHIQLPEGTTGFIKSKSGLNVNYDILSTGVIDEGYTGEVVVKLYNFGETAYRFEIGDKITQLVILRVEHPHISVVDQLDISDRGSNGFGSTGR